MMRRFCAVVVLFAAMVLHPAPASGALQLDSLRVPMDLVMALLGARGPATNIFVGSLPPEVEGVIPLGAPERIVGGLVRESGGTVVIQVAGRAPEALTAYFELLAGEGWERPDMPQAMRGGFQVTGPIRPTTWCGEEYLVNPSSMGLGETTYLRLSYMRRQEGRTVCDMPDRTMPGRDPYGGLHFPDLEPPPGAVVTTRGSGMGSHGINMEAAIESALSAELILEHYAEQLEAAGWIRQGWAVGDGVSAGRWQVQDGEGDASVGTMSLWALPGEHLYRAWLRLDRADPL